MSADIPISYTVREARSDSSDETQAEVQILKALAAGKKPLTGESLPDESCYQSAKVLRALLAAIQVLEKVPRKRNLPQCAGQPWSAKEDVDLGRHFDQGVKIPDLAHKHERTVRAIQSRLAKLGKIPPLYGEMLPPGRNAGAAAGST